MLNSECIGYARLTASFIVQERSEVEAMWRLTGLHLARWRAWQHSTTQQATWEAGSSKHTTHSRIAGNSSDLSHGVAAGVLGASDGDCARVRLLVNLNIGSRVALQLLDGLPLLSDHTANHVPWAVHPLRCAQTVLHHTDHYQ